MSQLAKINLNIEVKDETFNRVVGEVKTITFAPGTLLPKREKVTLTLSAFTALSPPSGAKAILILLPTTIINLTLKSITGDGGTTIVPATNPSGVPLLLPLGSSPNIGILNNHSSNQVVDIIWL